MDEDRELGEGRARTARCDEKRMILHSDLVDLRFMFRSDTRASVGKTMSELLSITAI